ncbi:MAG: hypothetical protein K2P48_05810 [Lachnospiraceae bacterium]|nr:hypothetical protein [Lachnospiraceae bacterium]
MMESMTEIMNKGMKCLTQHLGSIEAEQFISIIIREKFDYTKWQREYFDAKTPETISNEASLFEKSHPFTGEAIRL